MHQNEPGCAVRNAVHENLFDEERYINYLNILNSEELKKKPLRIIYLCEL
ncbi:MAG: hypothetical protein KatS3mg035_1899 [Bacteroidia bacterium]|nr:MAG: hypothetical protein KatS3mg035_1899 [Bacteroidia bacterium]